MLKNTLSICIPTYNFGRYIGETLESIVSQMTEEVEVVILDGASTDNTSEIVRQFQSEWARIKYIRLDSRGGIDRDMVRTVDFAEGQYCWLFSADDLMNPGSIQRILAEIGSGLDLYLCKHLICTIDMEIIKEHPVIRHSQKSTFNLSDENDRRQYFELAETTEAFFSFIGGLIVKRSTWNSVPINEAFIGSCWAHVARLFEIMGTGLSLKYISEPLLRQRSGNDSFVTHGLVNRYRIAIDGFHAIADAFLGRSSVEAFHVRRVIRHEFGLRPFLYAKMLCKRSPNVENRSLLNSLVEKTYGDFSVQNRVVQLAYFLIPVWLYAALKKLKKLGAVIAR